MALEAQQTIDERRLAMLMYGGQDMSPPEPSGEEIGDAPAENASAEAQVAWMMRALEAGAFVSVLDAPISRAVMSLMTANVLADASWGSGSLCARAAAAKEVIESFGISTTLDELLPVFAAGTSAAEAAFVVLLVAVAALLVFVQSNWTGPPVDAGEVGPTPLMPRALFAPAPLEDMAEEAASLVAAGAPDAGAPDDGATHDGIVIQVDNEAGERVSESVSYMPTAVTRFTYAWYDDACHRAAVAELACDGEPCYPRVFFPAYLLVARRLLLAGTLDLAAHCPSALLWRARCARVHQQALTAPSMSLRQAVLDDGYCLLPESAFLAPEVLASLPARGDEADACVADADALRVRVLVEGAVAAHDYDRSDLLSDWLAAAAGAADLRVQLTGAKGRRTIYQTFSTTHLVVDAHSRRSIALDGEALDAHLRDVADTQTAEEEEKKAAEGGLMMGGDGLPGDDLARSAPVQVRNENEVLRDRIRYDDDQRVVAAQPSLSPEDMCVLLAECLNVKSNNPRSELTDEQMLPYAQRVLENPPGWAPPFLVSATALLTRSRLETANRRTMERAMAQMQSILDERHRRVSRDGDTGQVTTARLAFVFAVAYPPWWSLQQELGQVFLDKGLPRAALDMFEPLELWDDIVACYISLRSLKRAEVLIRTRLAQEETPLMWTLLGDVMRDGTHYERAWALSGGRFPRAKRAHGRLLFMKKQYAEAIPHFDDALAINPVFAEIWFARGMCGMFSEQWEVASTSFSRCVQLDPMHAEAWSNLAAVYQRDGQLEKAFHALSAALREKRENWRMWENRLYVCMSIGKYAEAMEAVHSILTYNRSEKRVDTQVLQALVHHLHALIKAAEDAPDPDAQPQLKHTASFFAERLENLLQFVTSQVTSKPGIWRAYAAFAMLVGNRTLELECLLKRARTSQAAGWDRDEQLYATAAAAALQWMRALLADCDADTEEQRVNALATLPSALLMLDGIVARGEERFEDHPLRADAAEACALARELLQ